MYMYTYMCVYIYIYSPGEAPALHVRVPGLCAAECGPLMHLMIAIVHNNTYAILHI